MMELPRAVVGVGIMAGTSVDAIDVAVVRFEAGPFAAAGMRVVRYCEQPYPPVLRQRVRAAMEAGSTALVCQLNVEVARAFAQAVNATLEGCEERVDYVASHGQTLYHIPAPMAERDWHTASTLQVGDASVLLRHTRAPVVVSHFREADMAAGGQGAPLVPFFDRWAFGSRDAAVALVNVGGIANVTLLGAGDGPVVGFDSGPGNCVCDMLCEQLLGERCDWGGSLSARGALDEDHFASQVWPLASEYFALTPPKSTGRERFNAQFVERFRACFAADASPHTLLRAAVELTGRSIAQACAAARTVVVSGGGALNATLLEVIRTHCVAGTTVVRLDDWERCPAGLTASNKEAVAFAVLGLATLLGVPANIPSVTGASEPVVLGRITCARPLLNELLL